MQRLGRKEKFRRRFCLFRGSDWSMIQSSTISTIIFDVGEVLLTGLFGVHKRLEPILEKHSEQVDRELKGQNSDLIRELFYGKKTEEEYLKAVVEENRWGLDTESLKNVIRTNFTEVQGTRKIIERLRTNGYKVGLLSDHAREWADFCNSKFNHHDLFDAYVYSFDVGATKKTDKGFIEIISRLKASPAQCLFIDDVESNIVMAKSLGMQAIQFHNADQLRFDLKTLGIEV